MSHGGRRAVPTVLKLIRGTAASDDLKDDAPKIDGRPQLPPGTVLNADERAMWDYLMQNIYTPGVHGTGDGAAFVKVARLYVRANAADAKIEQFGMVMKNPSSMKPELQPYTRLSRDLWQQIGIALAEIGATPAGRVKLAGPRVGAPGDPTSWDQID